MDPIAPDTGGQADPRRALTMLRIIWAALLIGQFVFFGVILVVWRQNSPSAAQPDLMRFLFPASLLFLVSAAVAGFFVRSLTYNPRQADGSVAPGRYVTGNILFLALCEGASLFGLVVMMLHESVWPPIVVPAAAVAIQVLNFPTGAPMEATHAAPRSG